MRALLLSMLLLSAGCSTFSHDDVPPAKATSEAYVTVSVNGIEVSLRGENNVCTLHYRIKDGFGRVTEKDVALDLEPPCDFVRSGTKSMEPQMYIPDASDTYHRKILMIVGGPPSPDRKDEFMPGGCGTKTQKIVVFDDRIGVEYPAGDQVVVCPSEPMEEVFFAT